MHTYNNTVDNGETQSQEKEKQALHFARLFSVFILVCAEQNLKIKFFQFMATLGELELVIIGKVDFGFDGNNMLV